MNEHEKFLIAFKAEGPIKYDEILRRHLVAIPEQCNVTEAHRLRDIEYSLDAMWAGWSMRASQDKSPPRELLERIAFDPDAWRDPIASGVNLWKAVEELRTWLEQNP